jgi:HPt (histidine-containing phosphotransfer) domain-containing protein
MATGAERDPAALERLRELGGEGLVQKMIELFLENTPARIRSAVGALEAGAWPEVERAAHSIKSSAASLGFGGVSRLALEIEEAAGREDARALGPLLEELKAAYPGLQGALEELRRPPTPP